MDFLKNIRSVDKISHWVPDEQVYHVSTPHVLSQVAGYLKFIRSDYGRVFSRGQPKLYSSMCPALFRPIVHANGNIEEMTFNVMGKRINAIKAYLRAAAESDSFIRSTPTYAHEPILQQYGFNTRWLDLVDNIWIALWFATHQAKSTGRNSEYINFEINHKKYSYIILMQFGKEEQIEDSPGLTQTNERIQIIDLRVAAPSVYIRPHSQHGLMATRAGHGELGLSDYQEYIIGIIRVETVEALKWQGEGLLSNTHFIFPPPTYDLGYRDLIAKLPCGNHYIGAVQFIGP